jgi:glutathione S-transferase
MIDLYHGGPAGHSAAVLILLAEKDIAFASHHVDLARFEQHGDAVLALNPEGQLPVLVADDRILTESFFILLYLDESHPEPPLGGTGPRTRYDVHKWGKYVETHIAPNLAIARWAQSGSPVAACGSSGLGRLPKARRALWQRAFEGFSEEAVEAARRALAKSADRVNEALAQGDWLAGPAYSLADIAVYPHLAQFAGLGVPLSDAVEEWLARVAQRPAVARAAGDMKTIVTMGPELGRWG